jgi:tryptophan-rich sensory protein
MYFTTIFYIKCRHFRTSIGPPCSPHPRRGWIFPIMWLIVSKPTQFAAVWRLVNYCHHNNKNRPTTTCNDDATMGLSIPLLAYSIHLSLGDAWNKVFFGTESTGRGLAVISAFWTVLWSTAYLFYRVDTISGLLLLPTCLWVTVAALLNLSIYRLN